MSTMFPYTPREAQARIVQLERELAAVRAASAELISAYDAVRAMQTNPTYEGNWRILYERAEAAKSALKALLEVQDGSV